MLRSKLYWPWDWITARRSTIINVEVEAVSINVATKGFPQLRLGCLIPDKHRIWFFFYYYNFSWKTYLYGKPLFLSVYFPFYTYRAMKIVNIYFKTFFVYLSSWDKRLAPTLSSIEGVLNSIDYWSFFWIINISYLITYLLIWIYR